MLSKLIEETKNFIRENWPEVAGEYIGRSCSRVQIIDPFNGNNIELGERTKRATEVVDADYPSVFKTARDSKLPNYKTFLLKAEGDYTNEEEEAVRKYYDEKG